MDRNVILRIIIAVIIAGWNLNVNAAIDGYYPKSLNGMSGKDLMVGLRNLVRNHNNAMPQLDNDVLWNIFKEIDVRDDGSVWDMFSPEHIKFSDTNNVPCGMGFCRIVPSGWVGVANADNADISLDIHNLYPCNLDVAEYIENLFAWNVYNVEYDNGALRVGKADLMGTILDAYEPCDEYKGDIARVLMYVAICYGGEFDWVGSRSWNIYGADSYPVLCELFISVALAWHNLDPVDEKERNRNEAIYKLQGNRNPLIDYPEIVEHLWGNMVDTPFDMDGGQGAENGFLQSEYKTDDIIWLRCRYVSDDAVWSVDGHTVEGQCIEANKLGVGLHELKFVSSSEEGKVVIKIE